ncbi:hypothetical protein AJ80_07851, partial [Polytolypa hystricis UAMH7299]
ADLDFQTPLIFDESLDFSDPEESRFVGAFSDGLYAKSGGLFSMSTYEKSPQVDLLDYDNTRTLHDTAAFSAYAQPPYVTHLFPSTLESTSLPDDDSVHFATNHDYSATPPFDFPHSPSLDVDFQHLPEVASFSPPSGPEGTKLSVYLQSVYDLLAPPNSPSFALLLGSERCDCIITPLGFLKSNFQYALSVGVPPFASTGCASFAVPIQMIMDDQEGQGPRLVQVGVFNYEQVTGTTSPSEPRKRRLSASSDDTTRSHRSAPLKQLRIKENSSNFTYSESLSTSPYSPYLPTPTTANVYPVQYQPIASPRPSMGQYGTPSSQPMIKAPSPLASAWSPSFPTENLIARSPGLSMTPVSHGSSMHSPAKPSNPTLIRTSTIQQSLSSSANTQGQPFNPYAMYPSKAVLKLNGDLDSMAENWLQEERDTQRRLVQFNRRQSGSTIHADFKPVSPGDRLPNSICISCIYWAGKKECFVTSVDTIYLLESLVGVRFTVEEKNRIRRNLEGFRPLTVSKAKPDSEDFFKVIMGFPNPKPRNIEKDVKVFPWKILSHALKKIIGKYSASYSSTAGALPTPLNSSFPSTNASDTSGDLHTASPRSMPDATPASTYSSGLASGGISPHLQTIKAPLDPPTMPAPGNLRLMMPSSGRQFTGLPSPYSYPSVQQQQSQQSPTAAVSRGSWEFASLVNSSPATTAPMQPHPLSYAHQSNIVTTTKGFVPPSSMYPMGHTTSGA